MFSKVKNVLNQWHKRKLTLIGRITVIKSLALSKFEHLFISLPEPPYIHFVELYSFGGCYAAKLIHELQNPFWKNLMHIWSEFCKIVPVENMLLMLLNPLSGTIVI